MRMKLTVLLAAFLIYHTAVANTFIVTSNADSGSGTLREAIIMANANGTATTDYINFNIPQAVFNLRIIDLVTELPALSSNIVIDGTTQPGATYGTTSAKICLRKLDYAAQFSMITVENAVHTEIYGFCLYYGYWQGLFGSPARSQQLYGINLINSKNIIIGMPAKGNVINGVASGIYSDSVSCSDITIQSNYIGQGGFYADPANDLDAVVLPVDCCITFGNVANIFIGGNTPASGNILGSKDRGINIDSRYSNGNGLIRIQNNILSKSYDKTTLIATSDSWDTYISIGRSRNNPVSWTSNTTIDYRIEILDNIISSDVSIRDVSDSIIIKRNRFDTIYPYNDHQQKLAIFNCSRGGIIGGENAADANYFKTKSPGTDNRSMYLFDDGPITVLKNVFECNSTTSSTTQIGNEYVPIPFAQVDSTTSGYVGGTATPDTRIDLYYDDECTACEGKLYFANVIAGDDGKWSYTGPVNGTVVAVSTNSQGYSSQFSTPMFDATNIQVKDSRCGQNNGSITGITTKGAETYFWINVDTKDTASRSLDFINAPPGDYFLYAVHGGTCINIMSPNIEVHDVTPKISPADLAEVIQPSCGKFNGSIRGLLVYDWQYAIYKWVNEAGVIVSNQTNLDSVGPGTYKFIVTDTGSVSNCGDSLTFTLTNQSGPTLNTSDIKINSSTCSLNNGSITGLTASNVNGTPVIEWYDSLNNVVGNNYDLVNVLPGKYRFTFKDAGGCDTIQSPYYTVPGSGTVEIDTTGMLVTASSCSSASGSIQHITITNGGSYRWINTADNSTIGNTSDIFNLPSGNYVLVVTNSDGCSKTSPVITVPPSTFNPIAVTGVAVTNALCSQNTGSVTISSFSGNALLYTFRWADSVSGQNISTGTSIADLAAGTYQLFAKDNNGCEKNIYTATVVSIPPPVINYDASFITNDECRLMQGGVLLNITGLAGPTTYTWYDENDEIVGTGINLQNVVAGAYTVTVTDGMVCTVHSNPFLVGNDNSALPPPVYDDVIIPRHADAVINIKNPADGNYSLYFAPGGTQPAFQSNDGNFIIPSVPGDTTVYIKRSKGFCYSNTVAVHITVVDKSYFTIPTAFTPNGDGVNDKLNVRGIGITSLDYFRIYNQWGKLVFETHRLNDGWDGTINGIAQNTASFVWIARGKDITGSVLSGKGTFVLIH